MRCGIKNIVGSGLIIAAIAFGATGASAQRYLDNGGCLRESANDPPPNSAYNRTYRLVNRCYNQTPRQTFTIYYTYYSSSSGTTYQRDAFVGEEWTYPLMRNDTLEVTEVNYN